MNKVTKNNILKYIEMKKEYEKKPTQEVLEKINYYTDNVINKDKRYYGKILSYNLTKDDLKYCIEIFKQYSFVINNNRIALQDRDKKLFYYELREYDNGNGYTIENNVTVNFAGTLISNFDVLNGKEYIDYNDFIEQMGITKLYEKG